MKCERLCVCKEGGLAFKHMSFNDPLAHFFSTGCGTDAFFLMFPHNVACCISTGEVSADAQKKVQK